MASFTFIQKQDDAEQARLCAVSGSQLTLTDGRKKSAAQVEVGDVLRLGKATLRVDDIETAA